MAEPVAVVNPSSANGATGRAWPRLAQLLGRALGRFTPVFTRRRGEGMDLARRAVDDGAELVISVGGDGTHNEVVNGLFEGRALRNPLTELALVPAGTGGDLRRSLGLPLRPAESIARLAQGAGRAGGAAAAGRRIDVGRLTYTDPQGAEAQRLFLNVASCGVSGKVVEVVNGSGKWLGGRASFALGSMRALAGYRDQEIEIEIDDGPARALAVTTLAVANGQYFGGGMWVAPQAALDDGLLDVTIWRGFGLKDFIFKAPRLYDGTHLALPGAESHRVRTIAARSRASVLLEVDGEQPGTLPARWELLPGALWLRGAGH